MPSGLVTPETIPLLKAETIYGRIQAGVLLSSAKPEVRRALSGSAPSSFIAMTRNSPRVSVPSGSKQRLPAMRFPV